VGFAGGDGYEASGRRGTPLPSGAEGTLPVDAGGCALKALLIVHNVGTPAGFEGMTTGHWLMRFWSLRTPTVNVHNGDTGWLPSPLSTAHAPSGPVRTDKRQGANRYFLTRVRDAYERTGGGARSVAKLARKHCSLLCRAPNLKLSRRCAGIVSRRSWVKATATLRPLNKGWTGL